MIVVKGMSECFAANQILQFGHYTLILKGCIFWTMLVWCCFLFRYRYLKNNSIIYKNVLFCGIVYKMQTQTLPMFVISVICRQRGRVVKPGLMTNTVSVQNPLAPFCCVLDKRHFTAYCPAWWSWQAVLNYSHISIKLQADRNILASPEAGQSNCLPYALAPPSLFCESEE